MRFIGNQKMMPSEFSKSPRFSVWKQPRGSRGLRSKLANPAVQLISKPRDVYNSTYHNMQKECELIDLESHFQLQNFHVPKIWAQQ